MNAERDLTTREVGRLEADNASVASLVRSADLGRAQTELKLEQVISEKRNLEKSQQNERERSVKVLSAAQERISSAESRTEKGLKAVLGFTYVVIVGVALVPDYAASRILVSAVAILSIAGFFTFTPTIEKWLAAAAKRWHRSERRQLAEMAQSLGLGELVE
ncbi:MAG: hypothetical protein IPP82_16820 [Xanthomonadales bacterium]|nr:hypothetical protein [Xanthomonadales bacterium]